MSQTLDRSSPAGVYDPFGNSLGRAKFIGEAGHDGSYQIHYDDEIWLVGPDNKLKRLSDGTPPIDDALEVRNIDKKGIN